MIDRTHALPLPRQAKVVGISRGSVYYQPRPVGEADLALMRQNDAPSRLSIRRRPPVAGPVVAQRCHGRA